MQYTEQRKPKGHCKFRCLLCNKVKKTLYSIKTACGKKHKVLPEGLQVECIDCKVKGEYEDVLSQHHLGEECRQNPLPLIRYIDILFYGGYLTDCYLKFINKLVFS